MRAERSAGWMKEGGAGPQGKMPSCLANEMQAVEALSTLLPPHITICSPFPTNTFTKPLPLQHNAYIALHTLLWQWGGWLFKICWVWFMYCNERPSVLIWLHNINNNTNNNNTNNNNNNNNNKSGFIVALLYIMQIFVYFGLSPPTHLKKNVLTNLFKMRW